MELNHNLNHGSNQSRKDSARRRGFYCLWLSFLFVGVTLTVSPVFFAEAVADNDNSDERFLNDETLTLLHEIEAAVFNENWPGAESCCLELDAAVEGSVLLSGLAPLARATIIQARMFSLEEKTEQKQINLLLDSSLALFELALVSSSRSDSARLCYFRGAAYSYRSLWESKFGSLITAVKRGFAARDSYELGLSCDSSFADNKIGLGAFRYWKSSKGGSFFRWLGVISDERQQGLQMIQQGIAHSQISTEGGRSALVWILMNEKRYREALELAQELTETYPEGATFLWPQAECYRRLNEYQPALETYLRIRAKLLPQPGNQLNLISVDYEILLLARILEDSQTLTLLAKSFDEYSRETPRRTRRKLSAKFRSLKRL